MVATLRIITILTIIVIISITFASCHSKSGHLVERQYADYARTEAQRDKLAWEAMQDTVKYNAFLECSKDSGDAGCDSCWQVIYGYSLEFK